MGTALPLIAIYLYTKCYLNANGSFKVICQTMYRTDGRTDGQSGDYMEYYQEYIETKQS